MDTVLVSNILAGGGTIAGSLATLQIWRSVDLLTNGVHAEGRVTRYTREEHEQTKGEGEGSETVTLEFPHVEFALRDGARVEFKSHLQRMTPTSMPEGSTVTVLYNPKNPAGTAEIAGGRTWFAILFRTVPLTLMALGMFYYAARYRGWL